METKKYCVNFLNLYTKDKFSLIVEAQNEEDAKLKALYNLYNKTIIINVEEYYEEKYTQKS